MTRRCSHCSHNGHNSRTCPNRGVKLFGVRLTDGSIRKSASMGNLSHYTGPSNGFQHGNHLESPGETPEHGGGEEGYASEDYVKGSSSSCRERKKGVPWTEEEHRMFLIGLQKLGKGDWRGIARTYVISRTPTQVASHAQKYFIRQTNMSRRKRRSSLFDIVADEPVETTQGLPQELFPMSHLQAETHGDNSLSTRPTIDEECESMDSTNSNDGEAFLPNPETPQCTYPVFLPAAYFFPLSLPFWPGGYATETASQEVHEVVKPTAVHSKTPINVDELVGMSRLSLGESIGNSELPPSLSLKLTEGSSRQSAFQAKPTSGSDSKSSKNSIHAV